MLKTRVIPCLLLKGSGLVKTVKFSQPTYVGDIVNAVKIFNDKEVDEIVILDIQAHIASDRIQWELLAHVASECFMPMCYGGGISSVDQMKRLFELGLEKVSINTAALENLRLVEDAAKIFGSQSIVVAMDVQKGWFGKYVVCSHGGSKKTKYDPASYARMVEQMGAGEIFLNSIDRDGTQSGYDLTLLENVAGAVGIPVIACGGAGSVEDFARAAGAGASAVAAGSMFVFHGKHRAVLITYPDRKQLESALK
jgi:cyclase